MNTDTNHIHNAANDSDDRVVQFSAFAAPSEADPAETRRFLFLQGPHGSFFPSLARRLTKEGHHVHRIHLNGGDKGDWMPNQGISYTGTFDEWRQYLLEYMFRHEITDIVFYGYWRPMHQTAIQLARRLNIRLHGFEEGLLRPHWITLDPRLPCEQAGDLKQAMLGVAPLVTPYDVQPIGKFPVPHNPTAWMITNCIRYYLSYFKYRKSFPHYTTHRLQKPDQELAAWTRQTLCYPWRKLVSTLRLEKALRLEKPFFLLCLQLDGDTQIRKYSEFSGMEEVLETVLDSFAKYAPADMQLVIKNHPLDNGTSRLEKTCKRIARAKGLESRIIFLNFGKLAGLLKKARGMVAVNSSAGLQALFHHCPVKTLGLSVYNVPGLSDAQPLDHFWVTPQIPDAETYNHLHDALTSTSQHAGNFYDANCHRDMINSVLPVMISAKAERRGATEKIAATA